jgi:hypothetical protein
LILLPSESHLNANRTPTTVPETGMNRVTAAPPNAMNEHREDYHPPDGHQGC